MKYLGAPSSGSYQGITFSRNRNGQYQRSRAVPVQPRTVAQLRQRAQLSANSAAWRTLAPYQLAAWSSLGLMMTRTDSLGSSYNLTGAQAYGSVNTILTTYGQSPVPDAPLLATPSAVTGITITAVASPAALTVATTGEPGTGFISFWASPPQSAGRIFAAKPVLLLTAAVGGSPYNILTAWNARWGTLVAGQRIAIVVKTMLDGFESVPNSAAVICS